MGDFDKAFDFHCVWVQPRAFHVGQKYIRSAGDAEARMNAALRFIEDVEFFAGGGFNAVGD